MSVQYPDYTPPEDRKIGVVLSSGFIIDPRGESSCHVQYLIQMSTQGLQLIIADMMGKSKLFESARRLSNLGNDKE